MPRTVLLEHPLVDHHLTALRDRHTSPAEFRWLIQRLSGLLAFEATRDLQLAECVIETPVASTQGRRIRERIGLFPILRAGLGMVDPILNLIPDAEVWHLGMYRDEETATPVHYYSKLPADEPVDVGFVLDPMLATGGSAIAAIDALRRWGVKSIKMLSVIASRPGVDAVSAAFADVEIHVCAIDAALNDRKFIVPGLGDAGDRTFNTI
jgi:uracil phosphoribosyltransferase